MRRSSRRLLALLISLPLLVLLLALLYKSGMRYLEGDPRTLSQALGWVSETLTSTGYGHDNRWDHPAMVAFSILVQFSGVFFFFLVFPIFLIPFFEERFEGRLPTVLPDLTGKVVVYGFGPAVATLVELLDRDEVPCVIVEEDVARARRLHERHKTVVHAQLESEDLELPNVADARAIVANGLDQNNAVLTLTARQQGFKGPIVALVTTPQRRNPMVRVGATAAFTPLHVLAAAIASKASAKLNPRVAGAQALGRGLEIAEIRVAAGSELDGKTLAEASLRKRSGATVIGQWVEGELVAHPPAHEPLSAGSLLVCAGSREAIDRLAEFAQPITRDGPLIVVGDGELAHKVRELLGLAGEEVKLLCAEVQSEADLIGDVLDPGRLKDIGVVSAQAVILALENDSMTLFAATIIRDLSPDTAIIASAQRAENVGRLRRAGADFALSVSQVAGQLLAYHVRGEESVELERKLRLVKAKPGGLTGDNPVRARIGEVTGCSIVAVERGPDVLTGFDGDFRFEEDDTIYLAGTPDAIASFFEEFPDCARHRAGAE